MTLSRAVIVGCLINLAFAAPGSASTFLVKGPDQAAITIIIYSDFSCVPCSRGAKVLEEVMEAYPDEIRVTFKHFPSLSRLGAVLAHQGVIAAAEQGMFWPMHDRLMAHQGSITKKILIHYAKELKLKTRAFKTHLNDDRLKEEILAEMAEAKGFGVTTAPTFFINGRKLVGGRSLQDFKRIIDIELGLSQEVDPAQGRRGMTSFVDMDSIRLDSSPWKGEQNAPITIVEYSDFQCPYCAKVVSTFNQLIENNPGKIKWVFKHYPLPTHPDSPLAHVASLAAAEQGKFWEMHDLIFKNQRKVKREHLMNYAWQLKLDTNQFQQDLHSGRLTEVIEADIQEAIRVGARATPTFLINGRLVIGALPLQTFQMILDEELRRIR